MNDIIVSIYCLAYNHEKYIRDCLEGFVKQKTDFKFEVFVHDDASTDKTPQIIKEYSDKYPDIIKPIFQKENQHSRQIPIFRTFIQNKMSGKYVAICEGDDYWCDDKKLQIQVDILEANPCYIACCHQTRCINCISKKSSDASPLSKDGVIDKKAILRRDSPIYHTSSLMYRRSVLDKLPRFCNISKSIGDYPMGLFLALTGDIFFLNRTMSVYRLYTETSWSLKHKKSKDKSKFASEMLEILKEADCFSNHRFSEEFRKPILELKYVLWKSQPDISMMDDGMFRLLPYKKKIKLILRIVKRKILE